jgi:hypothetical protein
MGLVWLLAASVSARELSRELKHHGYKSETSILMATFRNRETGKLMASDDPRLSPEALKGLGVGMRSFCHGLHENKRAPPWARLQRKAFMIVVGLERKEKVRGGNLVHEVCQCDHVTTVTLSVLFEAMMRHVLLISDGFWIVGFS